MSPDLVQVTRVLGHGTERNTTVARKDSQMREQEVEEPRKQWGGGSSKMHTLQAMCGRPAFRKQKQKSHGSS